MVCVLRYPHLFRFYLLGILGKGRVSLVAEDARGMRASSSARELSPRKFRAVGPLEFDVRHEERWDTMKALALKRA